MKINKTDLLDTLTQCMPGVEKNNILIDGVDTFVFDGNFVHSYNDNISVSTSLPEKIELKGTVKSMDFYKLVSKLKEEETEIEIDTNTWLIKNGRSKAKIKLLEDHLSDFIANLKLDKIEWSELPGDFMHALSLCSITNNKSPHPGIYINDNQILSTDMRRLNYYDLSENLGVFYISDPAVKELLKLKNLKKFSISNEWLHFQTDKGTIFSCRCMDSSVYPVEALINKRKNMQKEKDDLENNLPHCLKETIDRVGTLSRELNANQACQLTFSKDEIKAYSFRDSGEITETIPLDKPFDKDVNLSIWVDVSFLKEAIDKVPDFYIKILKIKKAGGEQIIEMPVVIFHSDKYTQITATHVPND